MFFGSNLKTLRSRLNMSQNDYAAHLGLKRTTLAGYTSGRSFPDFMTFIGICDILKVDPTTMIEVDLDQLPSDKQTVGPDLSRISHQSIGTVITVDKSGKENIVFVDQKAAAGYAGNVLSPVFYQSLPTFSLPGARYQNGTFRCFEVTGDSMKGSFKSGDWCIARLVDDVTTIRDNYVYVVVTIDAVLIKRVINRIQERQCLVLKSDNPEYDHIQLNISEVKEMWLGIGKFTWDLSNQDFDVLKTVDDLHILVHELQTRVKRMEQRQY